MRDIALATGVSQSTVSRVLSGTPTAVPIAEATRQRVTETAERLGYRPNPLARGLRGAPTMLLGVIVRDVTDPFFAGAIEAASLEANRRGYNVVLGHAHQSADEAVALWGILEARHCDALLFLGDLRDRPGLIEDLKDTSIPVVALWHGSRESGIPTVSVDNRAGMAAIVGHLAALGHRRIAFAGPRRLGDITEREEAYLASLARHGLTAQPEYDVEASNDFAGGVAALDRLMDLDLPPTAIVAPTDVLAIGMLHAAQRRGLRVPDHVSISGFDDIPVAAVSVPALTTVRMPTEAMIVAALDLAIGPAPAGADSHPVLQPELVVRASTGPVPSQPVEGA
jgi:DNA-binding LacI/PurR family transcriptional regulator